MITKRLAEFVSCTPADAIPVEARLQATRAVLDTLGVMLAGACEPASEAVAALVREEGGREEATVIGRGFRAPVAQAALVNGTSAHALDFDDVSASMRGHPSAPLLPALLALAERTAAPGRDLLEAFVLGFEVECRLGLAIGQPHYALGWHATSTFGTLGAAAACARLLRLDAARAQAALGIAASLAGGLQQNFGTMTKPLHAGWAAHNGVTAALLAQRGLTADTAALEGPSGFLRAMSGGAEVDTAALTAGLGESWQIVSPGLGVKLYPCCYATHRSIDAVRWLRDKHRIDPRSVTRIEVHLSKGTMLPLRARPPQTGLEGKFSLEYCLAAALLDGGVSLSSFTDDAIRRPAARELLARVQLSEDFPPMDYPIEGLAEVRVQTPAGEVAARIEVPRGDPRRPLSWDELGAKFRDCAAVSLPAARIEAAIAAVEALAEASDVRGLVEAVSAGP